MVGCPLLKMWHCGHCLLRPVHAELECAKPSAESGEECSGIVYVHRFLLSFSLAYLPESVAPLIGLSHCLIASLCLSLVVDDCCSLFHRAQILCR